MNNTPVTRGRRRSSRLGVSLLELVVASSLLAGMVSGFSLIMRSARQSWELVDDEYAAMHQVQALVRHFVRAARESHGVVAISPDGTRITIEGEGDRRLTWSWNTSKGQSGGRVTFRDSQRGGAADLAHDIRSLQFQGYALDGVTRTSDPEEIRVIEVAASVAPSEESAHLKTVRSKVWIRVW